jgi:hypothetical protein
MNVSGLKVIWFLYLTSYSLFLKEMNVSGNIVIGNCGNSKKLFLWKCLVSNACLVFYDLYNW